MEDKKFYWIKLKTDFFNREDIDFMLSQPNGCQYVVLYQMLCLNTANTSGELINKIGEMIVPYNIEKIVRDTKYFDYDTVAIALELYKKLGLIYEQDNGNLKISDVERMIGSESASREAIKKREQRLRKKIEGTQKGTNCPTEIRDKSIEYRDIDNIKENIKRKVFAKPTIEEINQYCLERNNGINAEAFYDFYESKDWMVGKNKMKDWKACVRTWEQRSNQNKSNVPSWFNQEIKKNEEEVKYTDEELELLESFGIKR